MDTEDPQGVQVQLLQNNTIGPSSSIAQTSPAHPLARILVVEKEIVLLKQKTKKTSSLTAENK